MTQWTVLPDDVPTQAAQAAAHLLATATAQTLQELAPAGPIDVFAIDPNLADTAALTQAYNLKPAASANCVLVAGSRAGQERLAACVVLAHTKADVNKRVKKILDVRKASFLPMERAVAESGMEYGGMGPIGLPQNYRILIDTRVAEAPEIILGSGVRGSKLVLAGATLASFPGVEVVKDLAVEAT